MSSQASKWILFTGHFPVQWHSCWCNNGHLTYFLAHIISTGKKKLNFFFSTFLFPISFKSDRNSEMQSEHLKTNTAAWLTPSETINHYSACSFFSGVVPFHCFFTTIYYDFHDLWGSEKKTQKTYIFALPTVPADTSHAAVDHLDGTEHQLQQAGEQEYEEQHDVPHHRIFREHTGWPQGLVRNVAAAPARKQRRASLDHIENIINRN